MEEDLNIKKILEYKRQGMSDRDIYRKTDIPYSTTKILDCVKKAITLGMITQKEIDEARQQRKAEEKEERLKKIEKAKEERKDRNEKLKQEKQTKKQTESTEECDELVLEISKYKKQGKSNREIYRIIDFPWNILKISDYVKKAIDLGILTQKEIDEGKEQRKAREEIEKQCNQSILEYKIKFQENTLQREEIPTIKKIVSLVDSYDNSVFYLKVCVKFGQIEEAIKYVDGQIVNKALTTEEREIMKRIKEGIQYINKKHIAIETLKRGEGVKKATEDLGLLVKTVITLNNELLREHRTEDEENEGIITH